MAESVVTKVQKNQIGPLIDTPIAYPLNEPFGQVEVAPIVTTVQYAISRDTGVPETSIESGCISMGGLS